MKAHPIGWTDATVNPIRAHDSRKFFDPREKDRAGWFCTKVSAGCKNCYAERMNGWRGNGLRYAAEQEQFAVLTLDESVLQRVLRWKTPRKIFWCDMTDMFHPLVTDEWLARMFLVMQQTPQHIHQVLTKRPERMRRFMNLREVGVPIGPRQEIKFPLPNVWLGTSVEDQETADTRIPLLLETPADVRWISYEPALGPVELSYWADGGWPKLDWVVAGGESGPGARPANPQWFRSVRDECVGGGVPFFFKQWGEFKPMTRTDGIHESPFGGHQMMRVGKKAAGRLLDGREWSEFPSQGVGGAWIKKRHATST